MTKEYDYINNIFNCYVNGSTVHLRVNKKTGTAEVYIQDYNNDTVNCFELFKSKDAALDFVESFRNDEHEDVHGLWSLLAQLRIKHIN